MLLSAKNVPRNSEGSRGDMYGEACCETCPVTHLVQLWRIILLPDFIPDRFLDLSPLLQFLTCSEGNIDAPHLLRKKLDLPTWYPNLEIKSKIEKTFWRLGQSTFFSLNKMRWMTILEVFNQELSQLQRDSCLGWLPSYGLNPLLLVQLSKQKESWSWCRSRFLAGFRNHGSRQQRHLADTYKASSDQPFHQRSEQE